MQKPGLLKLLNRTRPGHRRILDFGPIGFAVQAGTVGGVLSNVSRDTQSRIENTGSGFCFAAACGHSLSMSSKEALEPE